LDRDVRSATRTQGRTGERSRKSWPRHRQGWRGLAAGGMRRAVRGQALAPGAGKPLRGDAGRGRKGPDRASAAGEERQPGDL